MTSPRPIISTVVVASLLAPGLARAEWPFGAKGTQRRGPLTAEDLIATASVRGPRVSPDGRFVVFSVGRSNLERNKKRSNLYLAELATRKVRRLTTTERSDWGPRWAPDSRTIAFLSTRSGKPQIWTIRVDGGEAVQLSRRALGAAGPLVWGTQGKRLLFTGKAYPQCRTEACNEREHARRGKSKVKAQLFTKLLYRHWNHWRHGRVKHVFSIPATGGAARDLTPGPHDAPPLALGGRHDYAISPDGKELVVVKNTDEMVATSTNNDLFVRPLAGGALRRLTPSRANDHSPAYSPDGRYLAYLAMKVPRYESDRQRLVLYDRQSGKRTVLTAGLDRTIRSFVWAPDGKSLYFVAPEHGYNPIFRVPRQGGRARVVVAKVNAGGLHISPKDGLLVFTSHRSHRPPEVYTAPAGGGKATPLTTLNARIAAKAILPPAEHLWYAGAGGDKVHAVVIKPPGFSPARRYPLVVLVHGGPQGMSADGWHPRWNPASFAAAGYVVIMPNFHGSTGYGQKFTDAIQGDWGGKPYQDVLRGIDAALKRFRFLDPRRICVVGASYGGYLVNWIGTQTTRFQCLLSHAGVFNLTAKYGTTEELWFPEREFRGTPWTNPKMFARWSPHRYVAKWRTPTLVIHGQHDYRVTVGQGMQLFTALQRLGVPSKFLYFPDEDHFVAKPQNRRLWWHTVHGWLAKYLQGRSR